MEKGDGVMAFRALLAGDPSPISTEGTLESRTRSLLRTFDAEREPASYHYAIWMADMLDEWLMRHAGDD